MNDSIQYLGVNGISSSCLEGIRRLIQWGDRIVSAKLVTCGHRHGFLLTINHRDLVVIRSGFASGYPGEGPTGLAHALRLFEIHGVEVDEVEVDSGCMERFNGAALTDQDVTHIESGNPVRPMRIYDYMADRGFEEADPKRMYDRFPPVIPYLIIDRRLCDLAITFHRDPDAALLTAFRRLEDTVRVRSGLDEHGGKLFSRAFGGPGAPLKWNGLGHENETIARVNLFVGVYGAFRNPRAHSAGDREADPGDLLGQFLLANQLFLLEAEAVSAPPLSPSAQPQAGPSTAPVP